MIRQVRDMGDWKEVDGENLEVDSENKVRHIKTNDKLYLARMMLVVERG